MSAPPVTRTADEECVLDGGQDDCRDSAESSVCAALTPLSVAIAYTVALFALIALATTLVVCGRTF
ncbi:hypothetical protein [Kitasatospora brasiliensis]|uniref:hypothetical protein n=1 Tax=Kitasatospora brasiliensis TaxID=3058040 RepID=UPI00292D8BF3|nr:hypothetical protein [Kitasatospora sp. K002]